MERSTRRGKSCALDGGSGKMPALPRPEINSMLSETPSSMPYVRQNRKTGMISYKVQKELRARYNHIERKNYTKIFAKLFSHWLKTPLFRLHPLFSRERSPQLYQLWLPKATRERKKLLSTQRFRALRVANIWAPFLLPLRQKWKQNPPPLRPPTRLSDQEATPPPRYATTSQSRTQAIIGAVATSIRLGTIQAT